MATPPFNLDIGDPTDASLGNAFPANERTFRDNVNSFLTTDHDINTGHHAFPELTTTQITALTTPPTGMVVWDTTLSLLKLNTGTPSTPVWQPIGPGVGNFHFAIFAVAGGANQPFTLVSTGIVATVIAGGGGGGGGGFAASYGGGGGGASGSTVTSYYTGLTIGNTVLVTPGAHGAAGTGAASGAATAGGTGANSSVVSGTQTITSTIATGGPGGQAGSAAGGGVGGLGPGGSSGPPTSIIAGGGAGYPGGFASVANGYVPGGMFAPTCSFGGLNGSGGLGGFATNAAAGNGAIGFDGVVIIEWIA
jgi:hypothetical protein